mmetsp:Transcript_27565/g.71370  ORF Transcript_27565/g.71370 Transcript_27565/m.71370 type:complete len:81 (-) Transcript_27565:3350-3592(-)
MGSSARRSHLCGQAPQCRGPTIDFCALLRYVEMMSLFLCCYRLVPHHCLHDLQQLVSPNCSLTRKSKAQRHVFFLLPGTR